MTTFSDDDAQAGGGAGDSVPRHPRQVDDPEEWMGWWTDELLTMWYGLREQAESLGAAVLDRCDFPAFAQFCWERSSRVKPVA